MKRYLYLYIVALASLVASSCNHKDLCLDHKPHAHRYHIQLQADYRLDWEELNEMNWISNWPENYMPYDDLRPEVPTGLRVRHSNKFGDYGVDNISATGGYVNLFEGYNDILIYNNDSEFHTFIYGDNGVEVRATTRTKTRASFTGFADTESKSSTPAPKEVTRAVPWDILFANYIENYYSEKTLGPVDLSITLQPLVFTYLIRFEFDKGLQYVASSGHEGALSGMAEGVNLNTGETTEATATILFDNNDYTCITLKEWGIEAIVRSYGLPGYPNVNYPTRNNANRLQLAIKLKNNTTVTKEFVISDQMANQPHGGVIVVKGIEIEQSQGTQGSGGFDVTVDDWGDIVDIPLEF